MLPLMTLPTGLPNVFGIVAFPVLSCSRATESGCPVNVVTADLNRGAAATYCRFSIRDASNEALWLKAGSRPGMHDRQPLNDNPQFR